MNHTESSSKCCCGPAPSTASPPAAEAKPPWIVGSVALAGGAVPRVSTELHFADRLGTWKARWAIRRMDYRVEPGLYAVGTPSCDSPVIASANYKMSFDHLRSQLAGQAAWILVLDTQGVNVWCSAGKGTFGTEELAGRIEQAHLRELTSRRTVVVPQLAAPGVAAHEVQKRTGVRVVYGPVRAEDLPAFLATDGKATREMRRVRFPFRDRVALIPVELVTIAMWPILLAGLFLILAGMGRDGYSLGRVVATGTASAAMVLLTSFGSLLLGPALLPWLPGRPFSVKGLWIGLALLATFLGCDWFSAAVLENWASTLAWCLLVPSAASVLVLGFTGASTYTSLSGVRYETRIALPIQLAGAVTGLALWLLGRFL